MIQLGRLPPCERGLGESSSFPLIWRRVQPTAYATQGIATRLSCSQSFLSPSAHEHFFHFVAPKLSLQQKICFLQPLNLTRSYTNLHITRVIKIFHSIFPLISAYNKY